MSKPIKGTELSDLFLTGTANDDNLLGKAGNDSLRGGLGNDRIDGGRGVDTALFSGNIEDYLISYKPQGQNGHGADDRMVTVSGLDGYDILKNVEWLQFDDALYDVANGVSYYHDAVLDEAAQKPSTNDMIAGSGIPADHFGIVRHEGEGIELGLKVHKRFDSPSEILESDPNNYADGELHFTVDAGPGNPPTNTRAEWNFDFSIATGLNGASTDLDDFTFKLLYDVDKSVGTDFRTLVLEPGGLGSSGHQWRDQGTGFVFIADDAGNNNVTQNSENYGFNFIRPFIDDDPGTPGIQTYNFGAAEFDIILQAFKGSLLIAQNHIVVDVV
jgi:hypothetical protein